MASSGALKSVELYIRKLLIQPKVRFSGIMINDINDAPFIQQNPRILIIRPDRIGDMLITIPSIKVIRATYPNAIIDIVVGKANLSIISQFQRYVNSIFVYDKSLKSILTLLLQLPQNSYDLVIDPLDNPSTTSGYLVKLAKAKHSIGIYKNNAHMYSHCVIAKDRDSVHIVERTAQILLSLKINPSQCNLDLEYTHSDQDILEAKKEMYSLTDGASIIALNIAGSVQARTIMPELAIPMIKKIQDHIIDRNIKIIVFGEQRNAAIMQEIKQACNIIIAPFSQSFHQYAARLKSASMIISPDTSAIHLAAAWKTPTLGLFLNDNSHTALWTPYKTLHEIAYTEQHSVNSLTVDQIYTAFCKIYPKVKWQTSDNHI